MSEETAREPNEMMEDFEKNHHNGHDHKEHDEQAAKKKSASRRSAIVMAVMCALAAIANSFSGHSETEAQRLDSQAKATWAYYQSISSKHATFETTAMMLDATTPATADAEKIAKVKERIEQAIKKYDHQKDEKFEEATKLDKESLVELGRHQYFAKAVSLFQIGMVLVTVALVMSAPIWSWGGLAFGAFGLLMFVAGQYGAFWEGALTALSFLKPLLAMLGLG